MKNSRHTRLFASDSHILLTLNVWEELNVECDIERLQHSELRA